MNINYELKADTLIVRPLSDIDEHTASGIRRNIDALIDSKHFNKFVVDFSKTNFMDSTGIGMLLGKYKKLNNRNIQCSVTNINSQIDKILRASGLYEIFTIN